MYHLSGRSSPPSDTQTGEIPRKTDITWTRSPDASMPPGRPGPPRGEAAMTAPLIAPLIPPRARPGGREHGKSATARRRRVSALRATSQERSREACSNSSPPATWPTKTRPRNPLGPHKGAVCKTVGSAYASSNLAPAATCGNGPLAADTRQAGRFLLVTPCIVVRHRETMRCGVHGRIADGVHAIRTVGAHRRLFHGRPRTGRADGVFPGLTRDAESGVHPCVPCAVPKSGVLL